VSYDRQIDQVCKHLVVEEALFVSVDRETVKPMRPIASSNSVKVRLNGEIDCPSDGVYMPAQVIGIKQGPFTIKTGVNDTLRLRVGTDPVQTAVLPASARMAPQQLVGLLNRQLVGVEFFVHDKYKVGFRTSLKGDDATVFIQADATMASLIGVHSQREYRGKNVVPGWTLVNDPNTLNDRPTRLIIFDSPLRSINDFVEVNYVTVRQECRRCGGVGVEHDWVYGNTGEVIQVRDEALLIQEIQKLMFTLRGSNPFHPWYGTELLETIGKKLSAGGFVQNLIVTDIYDAFAKWQTIKRQQEGKVGQTVSDEEFPFRLLSVDLQSSDKDPTIIFVNMTIQNRSFKPIVLERGIRLPEPMDLLGTTQQQGLIRQSLSNYVLTG
jgi:hypothetical protein